jgi:hypothetical protein
VKKYTLTMVFEYEIETDNMEETLAGMEFPSFPDMERVELVHNSNQWEEVEE